MKKRIVIALGGNALGNTLPEQYAAVKTTSKAIVDLIEDGFEVIISHGNGPQVGMIQLAMNELSRMDAKYTTPPLSVCVAMSQGYIGYDLQNALREELLNRGIHKPVSTVITQVLVDPNDSAFEKPTKPIGSFMTKEEADKAVAEKGYTVIEDAGRGYRRVVASPHPIDIVEIDTIKTLIDAGQVVIAGGGGGIPVMAQGNHLKGVGAVIDKDFESAKLAQMVGADCLIILTAVEKIAINFGKPNQEWLADMDTDKAKEYIAAGHFAPGSMLPKVQAALEFAESGKGRSALITLLEKARDGIAGKTGTVIHT
jgi:carbamate kinase